MRKVTDEGSGERESKMEGVENGEERIEQREAADGRVRVKINVRVR